MQKTCSCQGGDPKIAGTIASNPEADGIFQAFQAWVDTSRTFPGIMSMQTMTLWDVMSAAADPDVSDRASDVQNAFSWIVEHPAMHLTKCRMTINSDWAEIGILTPSAFIDTSSISPNDNCSFSTTKITWGKEHSHQFKRDVTIDFTITNDGSPIDIILSHGSDGATSRSGEVTVVINDVSSFSEKKTRNLLIIAQSSYKNAGVKDNVWNSEWFYKCEVNPNEHEIPKAKQPEFPKAGEK